MSNPINICYASGGDLIINTIEANCSIWPAPILICGGNDDYVCGTEDGRVLAFTALPFEEALPKQDNSAFQSLLFALDNTSGAVQIQIEKAKAANERVTLTYRRYLESNLTYPSLYYHMSLLARMYDSTVANVTAGLFDLLGTEHPREKLTTNVAPGLLYI